jgi:formylmethanofuran dehydrogenase subunit B
MFSLFKKDPLKKLENQRAKLLEEAMQIQRKGDLKLYAAKMEVIDGIEKEMERIKKVSGF